ncbi:MAG: bifunctional nuclease family protein [Desulfovibrio sp.]|uniref:bifunctional nuclease family protein n=1 Tax=Desulfovibrio sp. 7SRBS1 TaxID=3378064 RepID=UPI003B3CFD63
MIDMSVFGLALDETSQVPVLILKSDRYKRVLPIWIGAMEAMAISMALNEISLPRPMTHDLLLNVVRDLGFSLNSVDIIGLDEGTFYAELEVCSETEVRRIDARPSDAVALAIRSQVPIRVAAEVLEKAGQDERAYDGLGGERSGEDKWDDILKQFDPKNKYKM